MIDISPLINMLKMITFNNWIAIVALVISLILAILRIKEYLLKTEVFAKIISLTFAPEGNFTSKHIDSNKGIVDEHLEGVITLVKLNLFVKNKDLNFKGINIKAKYPDNTEEYTANIIYGNSGFYFDNVGAFNAPPEKFLNFNSYLGAGKRHDYYLAFIVEKATSKDVKEAVFEYLKISFIDTGDKEVSLNTLYFDDFDQKQFLFEKEFWISK